MGAGRACCGRSRRRRGDPRLPRHRHAGVLFLRTARPEPAGLSERRGVYRQRAGRAAAGAAAPFCAFPGLDSGLWRLVRASPRQASQQGAGQDPTRSRQSSLVLRLRARDARRLLAAIRRSDAHAPRRDRLSERICPPARRRHCVRPYRPLWISGAATTLGHGVWLNEADLDRIAATGTHICHNCSSNFRLRSGVAPLNAFEQRGINTAIGLDEASINDDRDMLQEMRMVLRAHRVPGMDGDDVPSAGQVLRMATTGGAMTTPFGSRVGSLAVGKAADLVLINWDKITYPYLDPETSILDAVVQRGKTDAVELVMVAGEVIYEGGQFTRVDRDAALRDLHQSLRDPLAQDEIERRRLSKSLSPHVRRFYAGYFDPETHLPYYRPSSRV